MCRCKLTVMNFQMGNRMKPKKFYRVQVAGGFIYPPTGHAYAEGDIDQLTGWHKDDLTQALLKGLIIETDGPQPALQEELTDGKN